MNIATKALIAVLGSLCAMAHAQNPQQQQQRPAGPPLEGQERPKLEPGRPMPPPPLQNSQARQEIFTARNAAGSAAWITVEQGGVMHTGLCVPPRGEGDFRVSEAMGPAKVRAQLSRSDRCEQPAMCDTSIERAPGMALLELRPASGGCSLQPVAGAKPKLKSGGYTNWVRNRTSRWAWITLYHNYWGSTIVSTGCAPPGGEGAIYIPVQGGNYDVRTEMTRDGNCRGPVVCDTRMNWPSALWSTRYFDLNYSDQNRNCWLK